MPRNRWLACVGITGWFASESVAGIARNTHRGKAVTIQGEGLRMVFRALIRHTAMELHEQDGRRAEAGQPVITRLEVTTVGQAAPPIRLAK